MSDRSPLDRAITAIKGLIDPAPSSLHTPDLSSAASATAAEGADVHADASIRRAPSVAVADDAEALDLPLPPAIPASSIPAEQRQAADSASAAAGKSNRAPPAP